MQKNNRKASSLLTVLAALIATASVSFMPATATAAGGSGGGGGGGSTSVKTYVARVTGYVTAIDYVNSTITVGASYYGTGQLKVDASTNISLDNVSCDFDSIKLGDWAEARYDWASKTAVKLSCITVPTI